MSIIEALTKPGAVVPVDAETTGLLVREVLRLREVLDRIAEPHLSEDPREVARSLKFPPQKSAT